MKKEEIKVFAICIIESLNKTDAKTGFELFDGLLKYKKFQEPNITLRLTQATKKNEIFEEIRFLLEKVKNDGWSIILHFETHGFEKGIFTSSGEILSWAELMNELRPINIILRNSLVVILGMCQGGWIISAIDPMRRAPLKAIVATWKKIGERDLLNAFTMFYDHFLFELDIWRAVDHMNAIFESEKPLFYIMRIDHLFDAIANPDRDPEHFNKLVEESVARHTILNKGKLGQSAESLRIELEAHIRDGFEKIRKNKDYFLMKE